MIECHAWPIAAERILILSFCFFLPPLAKRLFLISTEFPTVDRNETAKGSQQQWHLRQRKAKWNFNDNGAIFRQWSGPGSCRGNGAQWDVPTPLPLITSGAAQAVTSLTWLQHYLIYKLFLFKQKLLGLVANVPYANAALFGISSQRIKRHLRTSPWGLRNRIQKSLLMMSS